MLLGLFFGVSAAFVWSASSLLVKAQAARIDTLSFNTFRILVGAIFFFALLVIFGRLSQLTTLSASTYFILALSVLTGFCIGDSVYFWSLTRIGASRAMPLSGIYPLFTWLLAVPLLGEKISLPALLGTALIMLALFLLARGTAEGQTSEGPDEFIVTDNDVRAAAEQDARAKYIGIAAALFAALMWAVSTTLLSLGMRESADAIVIGTIRLVAGGAILLPALYFIRKWRAWQNFTARSLPALTTLAIFSTGLGGFLFIWAIEYAGAARASLMITISPLLGVPLSAFVLKERVTRAVWLGTLLAVGGVWLILL